MYGLENYNHDGSVAKSTVFPQNWATLTRLPQVVFQHDIRYGVQILPGEPHQITCILPPPGMRFLQRDPLECSLACFE